MSTSTYNPSTYGKSEIDMMREFVLQRDDARAYFINCIKPRADRSYKLYIAYNGDRANEIQKWQANISVPYVHAVIETLMPRILDARPEFIAQGRTEDDQLKNEKLNNLTDYTWEISAADDCAELTTRSSLVYGTGFMQASWKKDVREYKFLQTKDLSKKKYVYKKKKQTFYDAPFVEWVDNYGLWYDWHNIPRECKQFWFKRLILSGEEIKRRYPAYDKKRLAMALESSGDLVDYASIRNEVKLTQETINKGDDRVTSTGGIDNSRYQTQSDPDLKMHEVFEWWRPFKDAYAVMVNNVPILKGGSIPNPYDFKEAPFIEVPYLKLPNEFEGLGLPMILENPQIMLNTLKNQRIDAVTLNIHKMWIVSPLANIDKRELITRPFGIIYSTDPNGVKPIEFSDIKPSAYKEEELLKSDLRYASGVDDVSMGVGGGSGSATEVRHLRESTLERVRLFINHLGGAYATLMRYWISMYRQFYTKAMIIRIIGEDGKVLFPLIEKDDLRGEFDYRAAVLPSIAGKSDIDKKQNMDLFQLLLDLPFIDPRKLTSKTLHPWNWSLESIASQQEQTPEPMVNPEEMMQGEQPIAAPASPLDALGPGKSIPQDVAQAAIAQLGGGRLPENASNFREASAPINLLKSSAMPPTVAGTTNPRGMNRARGSRVNTNIPLKDNSSIESNLLNRAANLQR